MSVPEAARAAAQVAGYTACEDDRTNLVAWIDAALAAAAPFIVAAAVAEERATTGRRVSDLIAANVEAEERIDAIEELIEKAEAERSRLYDGGLVPGYVMVDDLRAALASPGERCSTCDQPLDSTGCSVGMNRTPAHTVGGGCPAASPGEES